MKLKIVGFLCGCSIASSVLAIELNIPEQIKTLQQLVKDKPDELLLQYSKNLPLFTAEVQQIYGLKEVMYYDPIFLEKMVKYTDLCKIFNDEFQKANTNEIETAKALSSVMFDYSKNDIKPLTGLQNIQIKKEIFDVFKTQNSWNQDTRQAIITSSNTYSSLIPLASKKVDEYIDQTVKKIDELETKMNTASLFDISTQNEVERQAIELRAIFEGLEIKSHLFNCTPERQQGFIDTCNLIVTQSERNIMKGIGAIAAGTVAAVAGVYAVYKKLTAQEEEKDDEAYDAWLNS